MDVWLVADIGGTNARFGLVEKPGSSPAHVRVLRVRDHPRLADAARAYLAGTAGTAARPVAACLAIAGPVAGGRYRMNNGPWRGTAEEVRSELGLGHVEVLNDFAALALSLPSLTGDDLVPVGEPGHPVAGTPLAVLGPGTGLGVAGLVPCGAGWLPIAGEGGQADLAAADDREREILRLLVAETGSVSSELILSGPGLARLHRLLGLVMGVPAEPLTAADIVAGRDDSLCAETLRTFCGLLGAFAGDVALTLGARGGVYLGGGVLPRIADVLAASDFRRRFAAKGPMRDYLRAIPTSLIVAATPALAGAVAHLDRTLEHV
jgi:glucokinase